MLTHIHSYPHAWLFLCSLASLASLLPHSGALSCSLALSVSYILLPALHSFHVHSPKFVLSPSLHFPLFLTLFSLHCLRFFVFLLLDLWLTRLAVFGFCLSSTSVCVLLCLCGSWVTLAELSQPGSFS